jgi:hypothetical protein
MGEGTDLVETLDTAVARGGDLLTAGELVVVHAMCSLSTPAARWWARLCARVHDAYPEEGIPAEILAELAVAGLIDGLVPDRVRQERRTRAEARAGRADPRAWLRIRHRGLVLRLRRWATLRKEPDPAAAIVERLGYVRWPGYALTPGPGLWPTRAAMRRWERLFDEHPSRSPADNLADLAAGAHRAPGRLDLGRRVARTFAVASRALERQENAEEARTAYLRLVELGTPAGALALRIARTFEAEKRPLDALSWLERHRPDPSDDPDAALEVSRVGRRLARSAGRGWAPDRPLCAPPERTFHLPSGGRLGARPGWRVGERVLPVEAALVAALASGGRAAVHAEGSLWTTLFALLFADLYFLPLAGALPVARLDGPLDLGTPAFAARRSEGIARVLAAVRAGEASDRIAAADARWRGIRLGGAAWWLTRDVLIGVASSLGGHALAGVLDRLLCEGFGASRGLPDLVVLPGPAHRMESAFPSRIPDGLVLAEVKGPGDSLRPEQRVWADRLLAAGAPIEWWWVRPPPV